MGMKICSLGSGSKGNCTYVESESVKLLIDAGLTLYETEKRLKQIGVDPFDIGYILNTHNHIDHIKSIDAFCRRYNSRAVVFKKAAPNLQRECPNTDIIELEDSLILEGLEIKNIELSHDSVYCSGFKISDGLKSVAVMTDLGKTTKEIEDFIEGVDMLMIESNHDVDMLKNGRYPAFLKRRILSDVGHISNDIACGLISSAVVNKTRQVMLMHLSEENNLPELAFKVALEKIRGLKMSEKDVEINIAPQHFISKTVIL